jgi:hypothetical protein
MAVSATYPKLSGDWLRHELDPRLYRKQVTILAATGNLKTGSVLGAVDVAGATSAAKAGGNTGGGTLTVDVTTPVLVGAKAGVYTVRNVGVVANAGQFEVKDPDGAVLGVYAIGGAAFANQIKFAMADVGTDFALGDGFDITVAAGSKKWVWYNPTVANGAQTPDGILLHAVDASGGSDVQAVVVTGHAEIVAQNLDWHTSVDDAPKKAAGLVLLEKLGFVARQLA